MFSFSKIHSWQNESAVQQVLVFSSTETQNSFNKKFLKRVEADGIEYASDSGIGAVYKLRAVKDSNDMWVPLIRCGVTGKALWEDYKRFDTSLLALNACKKNLRGFITNTLSRALTT